MSGSIEFQIKGFGFVDVLPAAMDWAIEHYLPASAHDLRQKVAEQSYGCPLGHLSANVKVVLLNLTVTELLAILVDMNQNNSGSVYDFYRGR